MSAIVDWCTCTFEFDSERVAGFVNALSFRLGLPLQANYTGFGSSILQR